MSVLLFWLLLFPLLQVGGSPHQFTRTADYDKDKAPGGLNKTYVQASFNLRNILELSESNQRVSLEVSLSLFWYDARITMNKDLKHGVDQRGEYLTLTKEDADILWTPDLYFDSVRAIRTPANVKVFVPPVSLRLYADSLIRYSSRINFDVACKMKFNHFPFDVQSCDINIMSYSLDRDRLRLDWLDESESYFGDPTSKLPDFFHSIDLMETCPAIDDFAQISRQALTIRFWLTRSWTPYVIFYFSPTVAFAFFGWALNFVLKHHPKSMLKIILTLTTMQAGLLTRLPHVSYITYISVWSLSCIMPIYGMIWQWTTGNSLLNSEKQKGASVLSRIFKWAILLLTVIFTIGYWVLVFALERDQSKANSCDSII